MLSTLLNNVVSYFSKGFFVASFLPMLAFVFLNGASLYLLFEPWHDWLDRMFVHSAGEAAFASTVLLIGTLLGAYVLSGLNNFFRRLMEGSNWFASIAHRFTPIQEYRLARLEQRIGYAAINQASFEEKRQQWDTQLKQARQEGEKREPFTTGKLTIGEKIAQLQKLRSQKQLIPDDRMKEAVDDLAEQLRKYSATRKRADERNVLDEYHGAIYELMIYGAEQAGAEHLRLHNERYLNFGTHLAPTRMGNIAHSIQSYAERRYNCNLALFLSQLLRCVQRDANAYAALQDAKVQLDFLIACSWLTLIWSIVWTSILAVYSPERTWFLAVALGGPLLTYWWYLAATEQYRAFGDILKTSLDMFRFDLLKDLRVSLPADVDQERRTWDSLNKLTLYDDGHKENFRYRHPGG